MAKLNKRLRAAEARVASAIVVAGPSEEINPSLEYSPAPPERVTRSIAHRKSARVVGKDANPAPAPTKRRQEATLQRPSKRSRKNGPSTLESEEDSDLDPAALAAINGFKGHKASRTQAPHIEIHLRSSKDKTDRSAFRLDSQTKLLSPAEPTIHEHKNEEQERRPRPKPEPKHQEEPPEPYDSSQPPAYIVFADLGAIDMI